MRPQAKEETSTNPRSEYDTKMEQAYARALAWAEEHKNTHMLEQFRLGLEKHRRWMREGR